jgi:hypothetical protein
MRRFLPAPYLQKQLEKKLNTNVDMGQLTVHQLPPEWICNAKLGRDQKVSPPRGQNQRTIILPSLPFPLSESNPTLKRSTLLDVL